MEHFKVYDSEEEEQQEEKHAKAKGEKVPPVQIKPKLNVSENKSTKWNSKTPGPRNLMAQLLTSTLANQGWLRI